MDTEAASRMVWFWLVALDGDEASGALVRRGGEDEPVGAQQLVGSDERLWVGDDEAGELETSGQVGQEDVDLVAFWAGGEGVNEGSEELLEGHAGLLKRVSARTGWGRWH